MIRLTLPDGTVADLDGPNADRYMAALLEVRTHVPDKYESARAMVYDQGLTSGLAHMWNRAGELARAGTVVRIGMCPTTSSWTVSVGTVGGSGRDPNEALRVALAQLDKNSATTTVEV